MLSLRNFRKCCYWEIFVSCTTQECKMLQHLAIQFLLYMHYLSSACCLWEVKNKENFKLLALKDKWSRSLTQGGQEVPNIVIWLGKLKVFWKTGCRWGGCLRELVTTASSTVPYVPCIYNLVSKVCWWNNS